MPFFQSDGVSIRYEVEGAGPPVVLVHGFASNLEANWMRTGVAAALSPGNTVVMLDCRGHGLSDKPHDPAGYGDKMIEDLANLMKHLGLVKASFVGYSMGARLALDLLLQRPELVRAAVLGGISLPDPPPSEVRKQGNTRRERIVKALLADSLHEGTTPVARDFRRFAVANGGDLKALAAAMQATSERETLRWDCFDETVEAIKRISAPLLTIVGNDDTLLANKSRLAMLVRSGCHFQLQGRTHLTAVGDPRFRMIIRAFLGYVNRLPET